MFLDVINMEVVKEIERTIIKKYRKEIWSKFTKAVTDYELINENFLNLQEVFFHK